MTAWHGRLQVEPDLFNIDVQRLVCRGEPTRILSFDWRGRVYESGAHYSLSGEAIRQTQGYYVSPIIEYKMEDVDCQAIMYFLVVNPTADGLEIEGFWQEIGECSWKFYGQLEPLAD